MVIMYMVRPAIHGVSLSSAFLGGAATWRRGSMQASALSAVVGSEFGVAQAVLLGSYTIYGRWKQRKLAFGYVAPHTRTSLLRWSPCPWSCRHSTCSR